MTHRPTHGNELRSKVKSSTSAASYEYRLMVTPGFHCNVASCELARRGMRRGVAEASGSN